MVLTKRILIFCGTVAICIFLFGQVVLMNAIIRTTELSNTYGRLYGFKYGETVDFIFNEPLPVYIQDYYGENTLIYESIFYALGKRSNESDTRVLLKIEFNENFTSIKNYTLYDLPLIGSKRYSGLAFNGTHFWTIENDIKWLTSHHQLLIFSLDRGIVLNQTFELPHSNFSGLEGFYRTALEIWNNKLWVVEAGDSGGYDKPRNITSYDPNSLERLESIDLPVDEWHDSFNIDENGLFWTGHFFNPLINKTYYSSRDQRIFYSFYGYSLTNGTIQGSILVDHYPAPQETPLVNWSYYFYDFRPPKLSHSKIFFPIHAFEGSIIKFLGVRIYFLIEEVTTPILDLSIWLGATLFSLAIIAIITVIYRPVKSGHPKMSRLLDPL
ncbi:MAG: hypothetical protein ACFFC7_19955 [Candidatus Hermodarchaeota archaeon]